MVRPKAGITEIDVIEDRTDRRDLAGERSLVPGHWYRGLATESRTEVTDVGMAVAGYPVMDPHPRRRRSELPIALNDHVARGGVDSRRNEIAGSGEEGLAIQGRQCDHRSRCRRIENVQRPVPTFLISPG